MSDADDYKELIQTCELALRQAGMFLDTIDHAEIDKGLATVARADSVGHIFEPTMYRDALQDGRLSYQKTVLIACRDLNATLAQLREAAAAGRMAR